ncbi:formate dehydrogenase subunit gamma [Massilia rhizosphaerae]|uniref:formate dehydrogenase subunit gamma n=1 Tax=Massilia rhizosphaerae TaxID=2784389 RepID=UPI0018DD9E2D|nr:formate dehydrogenase subunit gamma [Massilia rhizosphaerae]
MSFTLPSLRTLPGPLLGLFLSLWLVGAAHAGVPNNRAEPAYAEEQTILQAEHDARTPEPGLGSASSGRVHIDRHYLGQYGGTEGTVILQRGGNVWRVWRNGWMATTMGTILVAVLVAIFLFYRAVGPARVDEPETGRRIVRFTDWERWVHWATAISFIVLAVTGLVIMFGKKILLPFVGHDVFAGIAYVFKYLHNFVGPLFIVCSVLIFFTFLHRNVWRRIDWQWFRRGGGIVSHTHVPAGFFNAGEKAWFWLGVTLLGLVMSATGLVLDFVTFGQTRYVMQVANYLHIAGATFYIAAAMGHIYIGTWGTPGAYEAMRHGTVDAAWAKAHHAVWYDEVEAGVAPGTFDDRVPPDRPPPANPPAGSPPPRPAH